MRLVVTGGGTGGHVFPALEIAKAARENGHQVIYFGSLRGQESEACRQAEIEFEGFPVTSVGNPLSPRGMKRLFIAYRSISKAKEKLEAWKPDLIFSTGGYSAVPVLGAAKSLKSKVVLHEQNSVPGKVHRTAGKFAIKVCCVFDESSRWFGNKAIRTGLPLRKELLEASMDVKPEGTMTTLSFGGSQGALAINEAVLTLSHRLGDSGGRWVHVTGKNLYDSFAKSAKRLTGSNHEVHAFLSAKEMADAIHGSDLAIARSGAGACCELALFGVPAIYVPLPNAHADHQFHNANAIAKLGGASVIRQNALTPDRLEQEWHAWSQNGERREAARECLRNWAIRDATERVVSLLESVVYAAKN